MSKEILLAKAFAWRAKAHTCRCCAIVWDQSDNHMHKAYKAEAEACDAVADVLEKEANTDA